VTLFFPGEDEILLRLETELHCPLPCVLRSKGGMEWPFAFEGWRFLRRFRTHEPLLDENVLIYAAPVFGRYIRDLAVDGVQLEGKPRGITESLVVLHRTPGLRRFCLRISGTGGFRIRLKLRTEDLRYRPDEMEAVVHHAIRIFDALVVS